jgi:anti-sigma regulatory factor (Ser/Thr protein kinase)
MDLTTPARAPHRGPRFVRHRASPPTPATRLQFAIPGGALAPSAARHIVGDLAGVLDERRLDDVRLLVTELVTNSVLHGGVGTQSTVLLTLAVSEETLFVSVANPGEGFEAPAHVAPMNGMAGGGRGLQLVDTVAERWGIEDVREGRVWFEVSRARTG